MNPEESREKIPQASSQELFKLFAEAGMLIPDNASELNAPSLGGKLTISLEEHTDDRAVAYIEFDEPGKDLLTSYTIFIDLTNDSAQGVVMRYLSSEANHEQTEETVRSHVDMATQQIKDGNTIFTVEDAENLKKILSNVKK